jgi:hypothetical protein
MDTHQRKLLLEYLPERSFELITEWLGQYHVSLIISRKRNTKMGDYRPPIKRNYHRISVNGDLHPAAFLVTLIHELAHLFIWERYQHRVKPHGVEWKDQFRFMLSEAAGKGVFEREIKEIIQGFIAGSISYRTFNLRFEKKIHEINTGEKEYLLGDIPVNSKFSIYNGRTFIKNEKLRTRFRCRDVKTGKYYLISPLTKVTPKQM